jgi:hypothetical protein
MTGSFDAQLTIRFLDWWQAGAGTSGGSDADLVAYRDAWGCPAMPMTQVKGILREAAEQRCALSPKEVALLFGGRSRVGQADEPADGELAFAGDASLPLNERQWFAANPPARAQLFGTLASTAIDPERGAASPQSLRTLEVAVPLTLTADIHWVGAEPPTADWIGLLDRLCAATPAFGRGVRDGLGSAIARVETRP